MKAAPKKQRRRRVKNGSSPPADSSDPNHWNLRLYVAGQTPRSLSAFKNLKEICEEYLKGKYHIEVIDLMENPTLARGSDPGHSHARAKTTTANQKNYWRSLRHRARTGWPGYTATLKH